MSSYTDCGTDLQNVADALEAYYTTGLTIHSESATLLIFSCTAIADHVIKLQLSSNQLLAYYGDAYSGGDITNSVTFGGSYTLGTTSKIHVICCDNTLVVNSLTSTQNAKIFVIGKLSNDACAVLGLCCASTTTYNVNHFGYLTASDVTIRPFGMSEDIQTETGKVLKRALAIYTSVSGLEMDSGALVTFQDISSCSKALGQTTTHKGADFFLTTSGGYMDASEGGLVLQNSILIEDIT
jgi:hypothetical protein